MIDIHTHILPDLDDGPSTLEEALDLAAAAYDCGTRAMVATPHVLGRLNLNQNVLIINAFREFSDTLAGAVPDLRLYLGSEIYFQPNLAELIQFEAATLNASRLYMLVEFPMGDVPRGFERELNALRDAQIIPIIAHPERNLQVLKNPELVRKMVEAGALIQLSAGSLTGDFGRTVKKLAHNLLKMGWINFLASDAHGLSQRGPDLRGGLEAASAVIGVAEAHRLVEDNPQIVLSGLSWPGKEFVHSLLGEQNG